MLTASASQTAVRSMAKLQPLAVLVVALCALATAGAQTDFQLVNGLKIPKFPNNIVAFPNRDFVHLDGYAQYATDVDPKLRVDIYQGPDHTTAIGAAIGTVSGEASGAFEINHPGALCWGAGITGPLASITPDITIGDKITVSHGRDVISEMIVADARGDMGTTNGVPDVTGVWSVNGSALTLTGDISDDLDIASAEVRVVAPDLRDRGLNRDVRVTTAGPAKPEGLVQAFTTLTFGDATAGRRKWQAVFTFDDSAGQAASNAKLTYDSGIPSITFSNFTDPSGNAQATTIAEFLEGGGPGQSTCPPGPGASAPKAGEYSTVPTATAGEIKVLWTTPADASPQAPRRTGYVVSARAKSAAAPSKFTEVGQYIADPAATSTVLTLPASSQNAADYTIKVRSEVTGENLSTPFPLSTGSGAPTTGTADPTPCSVPNVTETVSGSKVMLAATPNVPIYYTSDNTSALQSGAFTADSAKTYNAATGVPIPAGGLTLSWVAFGATGDCAASEGPHNVSAAATPDVTAPPTTSGLSEGQQLKVFTAWTNADSAAVSFIVQVFKGTATAPPAAVDANTTTVLPTSFNATVAANSATFPRPGTSDPTLVAGDSYWFRVAGVNADGKAGPYSIFNTKPLTVSPVTDSLVVTQNRYKAGSDWRVAGTATSPAGTIISICTGDYCDASTKSKTINGITPFRTTAGVAPAPADWSIRLTKNAVPSLPLGTTLYISSSGGGKITSNTAGRRRRQLL